MGLHVETSNYTLNNEQYWETKYFGFGDMISTLGAAIIIIPVIAILESVAIAKAFGRKLVIILCKF